MYLLKGQRRNTKHLQDGGDRKESYRTRAGLETCGRASTKEYNVPPASAPIRIVPEKTPVLSWRELGEAVVAEGRNTDLQRAGRERCLSRLVSGWGVWGELAGSKTVGWPARFRTAGEGCGGADR